MKIKIFLILLLFLVACKAQKMSSEIPMEEEIADEEYFEQEKRKEKLEALKISRDSARNACREIKVNADYNGWQTYQVGEFKCKLPADYQVISSQDSLILKKNADIINIKAAWLLRWELIPKLFERPIKAKARKLKGLFTEYPRQNLTFVSNYYVNKLEKKNLGYQISYPTGKTGFSEILIQNFVNQESLKIYGENLSKKATEDVIRISQSVEYQPVKKVYILSVNREECDENITKEQLEVYISQSKKYAHPQQIERFEKISVAQAKVKLKVYRNCCEDLSFNVESADKIIKLSLKPNNPFSYVYHPEYGLSREYEMCLCLCLHCYELILEGIQNPAEYQFEYSGNILEIKGK